MAHEDNRPLSPHLQVYKPQITSVLSITHRATGVALSIGTILWVYWLVAIAMGPAAYADAQSCLASIPARIVLIGWTFALYYHLCNGIRHLYWDLGRGFDMKSVYISGYAVVFTSIAATAATWLCALGVI